MRHYSGKDGFISPCTESGRRYTSRYHTPQSFHSYEKAGCLKRDISGVRIVCPVAYVPVFEGEYPGVRRGFCTIANTTADYSPLQPDATTRRPEYRSIPGTALMLVDSHRREEEGEGYRGSYPGYGFAASRHTQTSHIFILDDTSQDDQIWKVRPRLLPWEHSTFVQIPLNPNRRCFMPKRCAVWLDHSEALIIRFSKEGEPRIEKLESGIESITKSTGGARARQPYLHGSAARHSDQEKRNQQLSKFYDEIVVRVKDSPKIILMGPGLAKQELGKAINELPGPQKLNFELHPAERMTDRQLVALARKELDVPVPA